METASDPKEVARRLRAIDISESYASQLANGKRRPSAKLALKIHQSTGIKLGPIASATDAEIAVLRRVHDRPQPSREEAAA